MFNFLAKTAVSGVIFILILYGSHTLYVRWRDQKLDMATEIESVRRMAGTYSKWIKNVLKEQRIKLAREEGKYPSESKQESPGVLSTNDTGRTPLVWTITEDYNRRNRKIFKRTIKTLSKTQSMLMEDQ